MMIIDENTERKLISALEQLRLNPADQFILHFRFSELKADAASLQKALVPMAEWHLTLTSLHIFLCEDGDALILAPNIPEKAARDLMVEVGRSVGADRIDQIGGFYAADTHANKILVELKKKIEQRAAQQAVAQQRQDELAVQHKRAAILGGATQGTNVAAIRNQRSAPELMVIEDDAFTRRLIENVLGRQYSLTSLGEADVALATYQKLAPNILFLDINLPNVTGHELLERIIALDPQAYVVMISGNADHHNIMQAMSKGAKGFIAKPFTREKLFQYIDRCPTIGVFS